MEKVGEACRGKVTATGLYAEVQVLFIGGSQVFQNYLQNIFIRFQTVLSF
ncbi:hypothetical protein [Lysinibacillus parviboronicapiens]|nr:hypothetical protein [Lysinibacillus parviboronicapiens]